MSISLETNLLNFKLWTKPLEPGSKFKFRFPKENMLLYAITFRMIADVLTNDAVYVIYPDEVDAEYIIRKDDINDIYVRTGLIGRLPFFRQRLTWTPTN
jgi:hypothetical protein